MFQKLDSQHWTDKQNKKVEKAIFLTPCLLSRMVAQCSATSSSYVSFGKVITRPGPSDYYDDDGDDDGCIDDDQEVVATSRWQKKAIFYCHHLPPLWLQWARIAAINIWLECYFYLPQGWDGIGNIADSSFWCCPHNTTWNKKHFSCILKLICQAIFDKKETYILTCFHLSWVGILRQRDMNLQDRGGIENLRRSW